MPSRYKGEVEAQRYLPSAPALEGGVWSALRPYHFTPPPNPSGKRPATRGTGGSAGLVARLDGSGKT
jgi:hypothetical protein